MKKSHSLQLFLCGCIWIINSTISNSQSLSLANLGQTTEIIPASNSGQLSVNINNLNYNLIAEPLIVNLGNGQISTETFVINKKWKVDSASLLNQSLNIQISETTLNQIQIPLNTLPVLIISNDESFIEIEEFILLKKVDNKFMAEHHFCQTQFFTVGFARLTEEKSHIVFNGFSDFIKVNKPELNNDFTISFWIKNSVENSQNQTKTLLNFYSYNNDVQLNINSSNQLNVLIKKDNESVQFNTNTSIPAEKWHHLSLTKSNETFNIYIDGVLDNTFESNLLNGYLYDELYIGAKKEGHSMNGFFNGALDELRIWAVKLETSDLRMMMNQEIEKKGRNKVKGVEWTENQHFEPLKDLRWEQLSLYLSMNQFIGMHLFDSSFHQKAGSFSNSDSILILNQTTPLPYKTTSSGSWFETGTWKNSSEIHLPCSPSIVDTNINIDWNYVSIDHDIISDGNKTVLGLDLNDATFYAQNDSKIEVSHYLNLMGTIDLVGKSQLIQQKNSYLTPSSTGKIERDQQGTTNRFNYNYWCSPVSMQNSEQINHGHTVSGVMRDGTDPNNPIPMSWVSGINPPSTSNPITLSSYWIFRFQNMTPTYANWTGVGANGWLQSGHGFTMKGSNQNTSSQNYVFIGKPNNGKITTQIAANNLNLTGNPYPSSLDAHQFIKDNINSITGSLYFWEHFETNNTHNLSGYQGGYAIVNLVGGIKPKVPQEISQSGSSNRIPGRFVPVGQGFMVYGSTTGGPIVFDNHQRLFIKEGNNQSNPMFRNVHFSQATPYFTNNQEDYIEEDEFKKIRLDFTLPNGFKRQLLAGYMNQWATSNFDNGFDAPILDNQDNEAYFKVANYSLAILGDSYFEIDMSHPLGIKSTESGTLTISLNETIHFEETIEIYIYDQLLNQYHNIKETPLNVEITHGTLENRFSLRFQNPNLLSAETYILENELIVFHSNDDKHIHIKSNDLMELKKIEVYNTLGQVMLQKQLHNLTEKEVKIDATGLSSGTYLVNILTDKFTSSKKIIIK